MSVKHQVWHQFWSILVRGVQCRPLGPHLTPGCPLAPLNLLKVPTEITWRSYDSLTPWIASLCPPPPQGAPRGWHRGCEEYLSNERKGLLHRGQTFLPQTYTRTLRLYDWIGPVGRFSENKLNMFIDFSCQDVSLKIEPPCKAFF